MERFFREGVEEVLEGFVGAGVDGAGLFGLLLLGEDGAEERQAQEGQGAEGAHCGVVRDASIEATVRFCRNCSDKC